MYVSRVRSYIRSELSFMQPDKSSSHMQSKTAYFFLGSCVRTNFLNCFAVHAVGNALQLQISVINVVSIAIVKLKTLLLSLDTSMADNYLLSILMPHSLQRP